MSMERKSDADGSHGPWADSANVPNGAAIRGDAASAAAGTRRMRRAPHYAVSAHRVARQNRNFLASLQQKKAGRINPAFLLFFCCFLACRAGTVGAGRDRAGPQLAIAPDASCFMPIAPPSFFIESCFMASFFMLSFDMLSLDIESFDIASFDIASFDIESWDIAPLAWAKAAPLPASIASVIVAIANFFMG